jgi:hypothetical protein
MFNKIKAAFTSKPNELANAFSLTLVYFGLTVNLVLVYKYASNDVAFVLAAFVTAMVSAYSAVELFKLVKGR